MKKSILTQFPIIKIILKPLMVIPGDQSIENRIQMKRLGE